MHQSKETIYSIYWDYFHSNQESKLPNLHDLNLLNQMEKDNNILEIGFGKGSNLLILEKQGYHNVFGIDISKKAIQLLEKKSNRIKIKHSDGMSIPFDSDFFDIILLFGTFSTISNFQIRNELLLNIKRVLKDGGLIFFIDYIFDISKKDTYDKFYNKYSFYGKFKPDWSDIPFVHYKIDQLRNFFKEFDFLAEEQQYVSSCRNNRDIGILLIMKYNNK